LQRVPNLDQDASYASIKAYLAIGLLPDNATQARREQRAQKRLRKFYWRESLPRLLRCGQL
jgi:hypothetical protein